MTLRLHDCVRLVALFLIMVASAGCTSHAAPTPLPDSAPWYNVERPLTWQDLRGRAVLLDFFSPGCINCIHMLPVEEKLAERFGDRLVIIGVDSPKFTNSDSAQQGALEFIRQFHVRHPIVLDAHMTLWDVWQVFAWPTLILVGPDGRVLYRFIGEKSVDDLAGPISRALASAPAAEKLGPLPIRALSTGGDALDTPGGIAVGGQWVAISDTGHDRVVLTGRDGRLKAVFGGCKTHAFRRPHGLAFHHGKLFIADTLGQKIRVVDLASKKISTLAGSGERHFVVSGQFQADKAPFNSPWDVAWADGALYVSMAGDHDIWRYAPENRTIGPWAGSGREGLSDGDRASAEFAQSSGIDAHEGTLYVADPESSSIRAVTLVNGRVKTLIGQGLFKFGQRDGPARHALLQHAEDVIRVGDSLYIADTFNNALRRLDLKTDEVSTVASGLKHPQALAALDANTLLVASAGGDRIVSVSLPDGKATPWPIEGLGAPVCSSPASGS